MTRSAQLGRLDVMVNNARYADSGYVSKLVDTDWSDLEAMIDTNFRAVLLFPSPLPAGDDRAGRRRHHQPDLGGGAARHRRHAGQGLDGYRLSGDEGGVAPDRPGPRQGGRGAQHCRAQPPTRATRSPSATPTPRAAMCSNVNIDRSDTHGVWIPAKAAAYIATCANPIAFTGKSIVARPFVEEMGLATPGGACHALEGVAAGEGESRLAPTRGPARLCGGLAYRAALASASMPVPSKKAGLRSVKKAEGVGEGEVAEVVAGHHAVLALARRLPRLRRACRGQSQLADVGAEHCADARAERGRSWQSKATAFMGSSASQPKKIVGDEAGRGCPPAS